MTMNATAFAKSTPVPTSMQSLIDTMLPDLTVHDRCDRCSARAVAQFMVGDGLLMFCGHHTRKYSAALAEYPSRIPEEHSYQFTPREDAARPRDNRPRDAGSAPLDK